MIDEKNLPSEKIEDEELDKVAGGQSYENPSSGCSTGNNNDQERKFFWDNSNGGH